MILAIFDCLPALATGQTYTIKLGVVQEVDTATENNSLSTDDSFWIRNAASYCLVVVPRTINVRCGSGVAFVSIEK